MPYDDAEAGSFIYRYQRMIFALVLYLIGGDRDRAYDIASTSFAEALGAASPEDGDRRVFMDVIIRAIENCRAVEALPVVSDYDFTGLPPENIKTLILAAGALEKVPFRMRVLLLLRDQMHLAYDDISAILGTSNARAETNHSRARFRDEIKNILNHTG